MFKGLNKIQLEVLAVYSVCLPNQRFQICGKNKNEVCVRIPRNHGMEI